MDHLTSQLEGTDGQLHQNLSDVNTVGEEPLANQGSPLSEAIEAISKLFGRDNGG